MNHWKTYAAVAAAIVVGSLLLPASAQEEAPPNDAALFAGKVAVFYVQNALPEDGIMIRDAAFEKIGGRWFLAGESPDAGDPEDWMADTKVAVDWARVESFNVLTEKQFQERVVLHGGAIPNAL